MLGDVRELHVYVPARQETADPLPVLYLLHGGGERASSWADIGRADVIADNLLSEGGMQPCLIVMPSGFALPRGPNDSPATDWADRNTNAFRRDLFESILPFVERTYKTRTDRLGRALAGLSMGAAQAEAIGLAALEHFGTLGFFSGGGRNFTARHATLLADARRANDPPTWIFVGVGANDGLVLPLVRPMHDTLTRAGIPHTYKEYAGHGHSWPVWRLMLHQDFLPHVFKPRGS